MLLLIETATFLCKLIETYLKLQNVVIQKLSWSTFFLHLSSPLLYLVNPPKNYCIKQEPPSNTHTDIKSINESATKHRKKKELKTKQIHVSETLVSVKTSRTKLNPTNHADSPSDQKSRI